MYRYWIEKSEIKKERSDNKTGSHFENFWGCLQVFVLWGLAGMEECKDLSSEESNFPSLNNLFIWILRRNSSMWSQVDVAVVNGKYFPGEVASRVGTGERWTGTPFAVLLNPSANKVALF